jgi:hypothetical protein
MGRHVPGLGPDERKPVKVRVPSPAPYVTRIPAFRTPLGLAQNEIFACSPAMAPVLGTASGLVNRVVAGRTALVAAGRDCIVV